MSTTPVGNNPNPLSWLAVLNEVNGTTNASEAQQVSTSNRSVTFSSDIFGESMSVTLNIPDDLDLPAEVTPDAINDLLTKLVGSKAISNYGEYMIVQDSIQKVYSQMAAALADTHSNSTGQVLFDLYQLMALLVEVAQSQRDAARDLRSTENQQIQNSIQAQANEQRAAALTGLIVGVTCGALSAAFSMAMMVGQGAAYKGQINATRTSGMDASQNKVSMLQNADTPEHAQAQLARVERQVGSKTAQSVRETIASDEGVKSAKAKLDSEVPEGPQLQKARKELADAEHELAGKRLDTITAYGKVQGGIKLGENPHDVKLKYTNECKANGVQPDPQKVAALDESSRKYVDMKEFEGEVAKKQDAVKKAEEDYSSAMAEHPEECEAYRAALDKAADKFAAKYERAVAQGRPKAEIDQARNEMRMARAYVNKEIMTDPGLRPSSTEYQKSVADAMSASDFASQRLNGNIDYRKSLHRIEVFSGINAINTAIGNMLTGMTQNISSMIASEATRDGADTKLAEEQLDQTKDLFQQAQTLVNAAVQMMQAVRQAEAQSMRDAIQA